MLESYGYNNFLFLFLYINIDSLVMCETFHENRNHERKINHEYTV